MRRLCLLTILALGLVACQSSKTPPPPPNTQNQPAVDDSTLLVRTASEELVMSFADRLKSELTAAIQQRGAAGAINVCAEVAPAIADSHSMGGWTIRRVSDRYRNTDNRATLAEQEILKRFDDMDELPSFIEEWSTTDSGTFYRFHKPIRVQPLCLNCHGGIQTMAPGVLAAVRKNYPTDKATGYKIGELRGMFVVQAKWPDALNPIEEPSGGATEK